MKLFIEAIVRFPNISILIGSISKKGKEFKKIVASKPLLKHGEKKKFGFNFGSIVEFEETVK